MAASDLPREELAAALAARRELGTEYEPALVESFLDRVDQTIDRRIQARLAEQASQAPPGPTAQFWLGITSVGAGIPITAIAGGTNGLSGLLVAWGGIAVVNLAYAIGTRRRPR